MRNRKGATLIALGLLLVAAALFLTAYNLYGGYRAAQSAGRALGPLNELTAEAAAEGAGADKVPDYVLNPHMEMPVQTVDGQDYIGVLRIPALELELPIISSWSYPRLKVAPCRYAGSAYTGGLILAGHNYPSHFGRLHQLQAGDTVTFTDMDGNVFTYEVAGWETLKATAVEEMESGGWDLTLFTCTVSGQSRVTVRCVLTEG